MKIIIHTPPLKVRQSVLKFVRHKVTRLAGFYHRLQEARVTLKFNKAEVSENKTCEIRGVIPGNDVFAEKRADSFGKAVLEAFEAIKRQLTDRKDRA